LVLIKELYYDARATKSQGRDYFKVISVLKSATVDKISDLSSTGMFALKRTFPSELQALVVTVDAFQYTFLLS
jgi:hypothetical protein